MEDDDDGQEQYDEDYEDGYEDLKKSKYNYVDDFEDDAYMEDLKRRGTRKSGGPIPKPDTRGSARYENGSSRSIDMNKSSKGPIKKPGASPKLIKASELDLAISSVRDRKLPRIRNSLEEIEGYLDKCRKTGSSQNLRELDARIYPYLIEVLAQEIPEYHEAALQIIRSTFSHFPSCNEAYQLLIQDLLNQYEKHTGVD